MLVGLKLVKRLGGRPILRDVDAVVSRGEMTAVIGPSGSGKSTLIRALSLVEPPDEGSVTFEAVEFSFPAQNGGVAALRSNLYPKLTVVFQELFLWPHLTVRQNLELPLQSKGWHKAQKNEVIRAAASELGILPLLDRYPNEVSSGQRQRAALARAVALEPRYLLLDEVTSALDVEQVAIVLACVERLLGRGVGILAVTHHLRFAKRAASRIIFMDEGSVVEAGSLKILESPSTERLGRFLASSEVGG